jgi:hypothetical protein
MWAMCSKAQTFPNCVWCGGGPASRGVQDVAAEIRPLIGFFVSLTDCCNRAASDVTVFPQGLRPAAVAGSRWVFRIVTVVGSPYIRGYFVHHAISFVYSPQSLRFLTASTLSLLSHSRCLNFASAVASPPSLRLVWANFVGPFKIC